MSSFTANTVLPKRRWVTSTLKRPGAAWSTRCCGRGTWPVETLVRIAIIDHQMLDHTAGMLARRRGDAAEAAVEQLLDGRQPHRIRSRPLRHLHEFGERREAGLARQGDELQLHRIYGFRAARFCTSCHGRPHPRRSEAASDSRSAA